MELAIVLTGTIIPNASYTSHADWRVRRGEYLQAIKYYSNYGPVFFLENSHYDIFGDVDFSRLDNVHYRKFPPSSCPERGKGYQEFEMLQNWLLHEEIVPDRFIKVTGRYCLVNFRSIVLECATGCHVRMRVDQFTRGKYAQTRVFCAETGFFLRNLMNCYYDCDDAKGAWIERVLYKWLLPHDAQCEFFVTEPIYDGVDGSTGRVIHRNWFRYLARTVLRRVNRQVDRTYLYA